MMYDHPLNKRRHCAAFCEILCQKIVTLDERIHQHDDVKFRFPPLVGFPKHPKKMEISANRHKTQPELIKLHISSRIWDFPFGKREASRKKYRNQHHPLTVNKFMPKED